MPSKPDQSKVIKGPESVPRSVMQKIIGDGCGKYLSGVERRIKRDIPRNVYSWINTDQMYENQLSRVDEMMDTLDPRFSALLAHTGKMQQSLGITVSTRFAREVKSLTNPMDDSLFMDCLNRVIDELKLGVDRAQKKEKIVPRVLIKRTSSRGHGADCCRGESAAIWTQREMIPTMLASKDKTFHYENNVDYITTGFRGSPNSISYSDKTGKFTGKERLALKFGDRSKKEVHFGTTSDGNDGFIGMRPRHVNAISHTLNIPLMVINSTYTDNLTTQLKSMWKFDIPKLRAKFVGGPMHAIDFAQFEATQPRELRHFIAQRLYSERGLKLTKHIDRMPIAGVYTDFSTGDHEYDVHNFIIDRFNNDDLAKEFSPLLSGTGDTALMGKVIGTTSQLAHLCRALNKSIDDVMPLGAEDSIAIRSVINLGDDQANGFKSIFEEMGANSTQRANILEKHLDSIENSRYFDNTIEKNPSKIAGIVSHTTDGDHNSNVTGMSHDIVTLVMNRVFQEQDESSPIRGDEVVGLSEALGVYEESLATAYESDYIQNVVDLTLEIIGCPYDRNELDAEAAKRKIEIALNIDDNPVLAAQTKAVELLGLSSISELDYKVEKEDLLKLPDEVLSQLWIALDPALVDNIYDFVSE